MLSLGSNVSLCAASSVRAVRKLARGRSNLKSVVYTFQSDAIDDQFSRRRPRGQTKRGEDDGPTGSDPKVACSSARGPLPIWLLFVDSHSRRRSCHLTIHFIICDSDPLMSLPRRTSNLPLSLHLYSTWDDATMSVGFPTVATVS